MDFMAISIVKILNVKSVPKADHYVFLYWTKANQTQSKLIKADQSQSKLIKANQTQSKSINHYPCLF